MLENTVEKTSARVLSFGAFAVTIFLWMNGLTDPVNATKLALLGAVGIASLGLILVFNLKTLLTNLRIYLILAIFLIIAMLNSVIASPSPWVQNFYGVFGRNTGFLTYLLLTIIFLAASLLRQCNSFKSVMIALFASGALNTLYCGWVLAFGDPLSWDNPYAKILGTFGNPDFISAFLGMFFAALLALSFDSRIQIWLRVGSIAVSILVIFEIRKSHAIQGLVVAAVGLIVVMVMYLQTRFKKWAVTGFAILLASGFSIVAAAGTLQKGPFTFLYKKSVSLRGSYWETAWDMGNSRPFFGIGMDSYIDSYRRFRPERALIDTPGISVTSNAAHNVFLDFFASGGYPLAVAYILVVSTGALAIIRVFLKMKTFDWVFVSMSAAWVGYQIQSIVSINQIGLAIWGWILTGTLVGYSRMIPENSTESDSKIPSKESRQRKGYSRSASRHIISPQLISGVGIMAGLLLASAPLSADSKWYQAISTRNFLNFEKSLDSGLYNPQNSYKYGQAINLIQNSQLLDQSYMYSKEAVEFNPEFFEAWKQLYFQPKATEADKSLALKKMRALDPLNPDVTSNQ